MDIPTDFHDRCRSVLLECDEFRDDDSLRAVFSNEPLRSYRSRIPEAKKLDQRVDFCLDFLSKKSFKGEPLLALFLATLAKRYPEGDSIHEELDRLAQEVRSISVGEPLRQNQGGPKVDVGILFALKEEFIEQLNDFLQEYTPDYDSERNVYHYHFQPVVKGKPYPYHCIATFVGGMGPTEAALATEKFIDKWKPATTVLVGIAGALDDDVMLGDVVIASQVDLYQEDSKAIPGVGEDYKLQLSGKVYTPSSKLRVLTEHFETAQREMFLNWQTKCASELSAYLGLSHVELQKMITNKLLRPQPQIATGHIASGPTVGNALAFKNWLKKERDRKFLALEMEAGGFMMALHEREYARALVLRAISDYGDERKKELDRLDKGIFRRYAVRNALHLLWSFIEADIFRLI